MSKINEMRQARAKLVAQAREILERAEKEKRARNADEDAQWTRINEEIDALKRRIDDEERVAALEAEMRAAPTPAIVTASGEQRGGKANVEEQRAAFWRLMRGERVPAEELRALSIATPSKGGYTVPNEFERTLIKKLEDENVMRRLGTVGQSTSGDTEIPVEVDIGTATYLGEGAAYTESDVDFAQVKLGAHKLGRIIKVSEELLNDSAFNIEAEVADAFGRSFGRAEDASMVNGDGVGKPTGVVQGSIKGADAAASVITSDNLLALFHGLRRPYRQNALWLMADSTALAVRMLKDANDQYIWRAGLEAGQPDTLLARPVEISDNVPAIGAGAKSVLFGDFSYYRILDRTGITMQRLDELYAANGQVGFRMRARHDGKLALSEAVVHLLHA